MTAAKPADKDRDAALNACAKAYIDAPSDGTHLSDHDKAVNSGVLRCIQAIRALAPLPELGARSERGDPYYDFVSEEPLDIIEANECSTNDLSLLATRRFRRVFNELYRLRRELAGVRSTSGSIPTGYRLLKDTTFAERSYPEHLSHESGSYYCTCCECGRTFQGHKRTVICKVCVATPVSATQERKDA